jgi:hypothetical protein
MATVMDDSEQRAAPVMVAAPDRAPSPAAEDETGWSQRRWFKPLVTVWLIYHLSGVVLFPASISVPEGGLLYELCDLTHAKYMQGLYMVGGHRFFAPEPGAGLLISYDITQADGTVMSQTFPRREISPRLMYHRYFMLSERSQDVVLPEMWFRMYARHLLAFKPGEEITLTRVVHHLASPDEVIGGMPLTAPELYERIELGKWTRAELEATRSEDLEPLPDDVEVLETTEPVPGEPGSDSEDQP